MFTIYQKIVGGRVHDRYFKDWDNAREALLKDFEDAKKSGWIIHVSDNYFDEHKGIYHYGKYGVTDRGEAFSLALLDGYFED